MGIINGWYEFLISLNDNYITFFLILIFILNIYYWILHKKINSFWDPFCLPFIFSACACSVVVYMYFVDLLFKIEYLYTFFMTEFAFLIGFLFIKSIDFSKINHNRSCSIHFNMYLYIIFSMIFLILQIFSWLLIGNPLQASGSRLEFYNTGTGTFIIIIKAILPVLIWLILDRFFYYKSNILEKIYDFFVIICVFLSLILSGAKSATLIFIYIMFFYKIYNKNINEKINKMIKYAFCYAIIGMFIVLAIETNESNIIFLPIRFFLRLVASGDIFTYVYSANLFDVIKTNNFFVDIFSPLAAMLRLIEYEEVNKSIGQQIWNLFTEGNRGPNPRHNIFGILYFGEFGGIIFSFIIGLLMSYIRNKLFYALSGNLILYFIYLELYINVGSFLSGGLSMAISNIVSFCIINLLIFSPSYWIYSVLYKKGNLRWGN